MTEQHPAVTFLLAAHEQAVALAEAANQPDPQMHPENPVEFILSSVDLSTRAIRSGERFIEANMPDTVLARVAAERDVLAARAEAEATLGKALADPDQVHPADAGIYVGKLNALTFALKAIATGWGWTE